MLIPKEGEEGYLAGPLDVICILRLPTGTYHVAFFEERPFPGPVQDVSETSIVRLSSKMHHTQGAPTLEGAQIHLGEMRETLQISDINVIGDVAIEVEDPVSTWTLPNWVSQNLTFKQAVEQRLRLTLA